MFDSALVQVDDGIAAVDAAFAAGIPRDGAVLGAAIERFDRQIRRLEAARLAVTRVHDELLAWQSDGHRSAGQWHRDRRRLTGGQAHRQVDTARRLPQLPRTADRVAAGDVTVAQAEVATRAAKGLRPEQVAVLDAFVADTAPAVNIRQLREAVTELEYQLAPHNLVERERLAFARRAVRTGRLADGGVRVDGRLDVVGGEALLTALSVYSAPRGVDDDRSGEQRTADALADLAERALRFDPDLPAEGGHRPAVAVTAAVETLHQQAGAPPARADHHGPVSGEVARQLACDAHLHRVLTGGRSEPLDVGRAQRTATTAQRRALAVRDRGCVGCGAPPGWTDAHHIIHWADGGPTDLHNLVLLCRSCHTSVHHRDWTVTRDPDGRHRVTRPRRRTSHPPGGECHAARHNDADGGNSSSGGARSGSDAWQPQALTLAVT